MKIFTLIFFNTALLFALLAGKAWAEPESGFSLNAGLANHNRGCNGCTATSSSGLSLGLDYQFALSKNLSINPFLMTSSETSSASSSVSIGHGIVGAQLRFWAGQMFFGGHLGSYSEVLSSGTASLSGSGGGGGLVTGWERRDGGLYVMGQVDSATVTYSGSTDIKLSAFRLSAGYRWK